MSTNSYLFLVLYSHDVNIDKRYFAVLYVAVPIFDMIDAKGKLLTVLFSFNFQTLAVP